MKPAQRQPSSPASSPLAERQNRGRLGLLGRGRLIRILREEPLPSPARRPTVEVIPPALSERCAAPWHGIRGAEVVVFRHFDRDGDGRACPHDPSGTNALKLAFAGVGAFVDEECEIVKICRDEQSNKIVRVDDADEIGRHGSKPVPLVENPVGPSYTGGARRTRSIWKLGVRRSLRSDVFSAVDLRSDTTGHPVCSGKAGDRSRYVSIFSQFVALAELKRKGADDPSAVDMGECISLRGGCAPSEASGGLDDFYFNKDMPRTFGVRVHPFSENLGEIRFRDFFFLHRCAPFEEEFTSIAPTASSYSSLGKQIVNLAQIILSCFGRKSDRVRMVTTRRECGHAPISLKATVPDPRYLHGGYSVAARLAAQFIQNDLLKFIPSDQLLGQNVDPDYFVATKTRTDVQHSVRLCGAAQPLGERSSERQVVSLSELDARFDHATSKVGIIIVASGHGPPAVAHGYDYDGLSSQALWGNIQQQSEHVSQVLSCLLGQCVASLYHPSLANQPMISSDAITNLGDLAGDLVFENMRAAVVSIIAKSAAGAPTITDAEYLDNEIRRDFALPAEFMFDDKFKLSGGVQVCHLAILALRNRSTARSETSSAGCSEAPLDLFLIHSGFNPELDGVVDFYPMRGDRGAATVLNTLREFTKSRQRLPLGGVNFAGGARSRLFRSQAIDQPAGIFFLAVKRGPKNGTAVSGFQITYFVRHAVWLSEQCDSSSPFSDTVVGPSIAGTADNDASPIARVSERNSFPPYQGHEVAA